MVAVDIELYFSEFPKCCETGDLHVGMLSSVTAIAVITVHAEYA